MKEKSKVRMDVEVSSDKRKKLTDVKEDDEDDGAEVGASQLLAPPLAAGVRGRSPASTPSSPPSASHSVSPALSRSPSPLPPTADFRSPSPLPALSSASLPLPDLTGVYMLDKKRSQSLTPLLARHHIRTQRAVESAATRLRQCKNGVKPSPIPLLPATLCEVVCLSCEQSTITTAYYVCKQWAGLPLTSYPLSCFMLVANEHFTADGTKRTVQSELHPPVEARCVVREGAIVAVEAEGELSGGDRWRETSELKRTADGLELAITRLEAGRQPLVVKRYYQLASGLALSAVSDVKEEQKAMKDDKVDASVQRKESVERDALGLEDDSAKVIEQPTQIKAEKEELAGEVEIEEAEEVEIEQLHPAAEHEEVQSASTRRERQPHR